jgi:predicted phosphodiesterase
MTFGILHLSDLHFGKKCRLNANSPPSSNESVKDLLYDLSAQRALGIQAVVISGDFTSDGLKEQFDACRSFILALSEGLKIPIRDFVLVPGNHDIAWYQVDEHNPAKRTPNCHVTAPRLYREFLHELRGDATFTTDYLTDIVQFPKERVVIVGLNSCRFESPQNVGLGYVGKAQIWEVIQRLRAMSIGSEYLKVAVLHHHLLPVLDVELGLLIRPRGERNYSLTLDAAGILETLLADNFAVILHGHMHLPFRSIERRAPFGSRYGSEFRGSIAVLGAGSFGLSSSSDSKGVHYQVVSIDEYKVTLRSFWSPYSGHHLGPLRHRLVTIERNALTTPHCLYSLPAPEELEKVRKLEDIKATWLLAAQLVGGNLSAMEALRKDAYSLAKAAIPNLTPSKFEQCFECVWRKLMSCEDPLKMLEGYFGDSDSTVSFPEYMSLLVVNTWNICHGC